MQHACLLYTLMYANIKGEKTFGVVLVQSQDSL